MKDPCDDLDRLLRDHDWTGNWEELWSRLEQLSDVEDCIVRGLTRARDMEDWWDLWPYVLAALRRPSRTMTPVLCDLLRRHDEEINNEDIVEVLWDLRDPRSVDCLKDLLWWTPETDEYRHLARKALETLHAIGTPEAIDAIRDAASVGDERVRERALEILGKDGQ